MKEPARYLVTAALPYANGPLHIGQIAGAYLPPDIYVRYLRSRGRDVAFICGSDEHGAAITLRARKEGLHPRDIIDKFHTINANAFVGLGIDFDIYHRTSEQLHHQTASDVFKVLDEKGEFEIRESEQLYDEEFNQFLADRYVMGTCPKCGNENAYGDQCERCGTSLSPSDLIDPKSTLSGTTPVMRKTKHWYFPLNKYEDWLREWMGAHEENWKKNVVGQVGSWLDDGLHPRAMTRDLDWGVKVPAEDAEGKVLYVWLDAPVGYISATKQWASDKGIDWEPYWKSDDTKLLHFIGKDNIVFHCVIFPSILKAHGDFILPANVPANEFMNMEGDKLSTSRNWAVWIPEYLEEFGDKVDVLRYVLCANAPESQDSEFTWKDWQTRNNSELVATFGNFANRVLVLINKYFEGEIPALAPDAKVISKDGEVSYAEVSKDLAAGFEKLSGLIESYKFRAALRAMMEIAEYGNGFLQLNEPWKVWKTDPDQVKNSLNVGLQILAALSVAAEPFLPFTSARLRGMLNLPEVERESWNDCLQKLQHGEALVEASGKLGDVGLLFEKIEDGVVQKKLDELAAIKAANEAAAAEKAGPSYPPLKETITYDDFVKLDIRTGTILTAEKMPKADRLLKLEVDLGFEKRTIVSGIAEHFDAEKLPGTRVSVLANLAPRKLRGVESNGMILMAEDSEGKLSFVNPTGEEGPNGSTVA